MVEYRAVRFVGSGPYTALGAFKDTDTIRGVVNDPTTATKDQQLVHDGSTFSPIKSRTVNVRNYGALGDNITDDTAAFTAAINAANKAGTIEIPKGMYRINGTLSPYAGQIFIGAGVVDEDDGVLYNASNGTVLRHTDNSSPGSDLFLLTNPATHVQIRDMTLLGSAETGGDSDSTGALISINLGCHFTKISNIRIDQHGAGTGVQFNSVCLFCKLEDARIFDCLNGILLSGGACNNNVVQNVEVAGNMGAYGILCDATGAPTQFAFRHVTVEPTSTLGHIGVLNAGAAIHFDGIRIENPNVGTNGYLHIVEGARVTFGGSRYNVTEAISKTLTSDPMDIAHRNFVNEVVDPLFLRWGNAPTPPAGWTYQAAAGHASTSANLEWAKVSTPGDRPEFAKRGYSMDLLCTGADGVNATYRTDLVSDNAVALKALDAAVRAAGGELSMGVFAWVRMTANPTGTGTVGISAIHDTGGGGTGGVTSTLNEWTFIEKDVRINDPVTLGLNIVVNLLGDGTRGQIYGPFLYTLPGLHRSPYIIDEFDQEHGLIGLNRADEFDRITLKATPTGADLMLIEDSADSYNKKYITVGTLGVGGGGGSVNSASNLGVQPPAVGIYENLVGSDLTFKSLLSLTPAITINESVDELTVDFDIVPGSIDHDDLGNIPANAHLDWTAASVGTIDPTNYTAGGAGSDTTAFHTSATWNTEVGLLANKATPAAGDQIIINDSDAPGVPKTILVSSISTAAVNSWETVNTPAGSNVAATSATDTLILGQGTGLTITGDGADTVDFALDLANIDHDSLLNYDPLEHKDWANAGVGTIHVSNYTPGGAYTDTTAIHDSLAGEIEAIAKKTSADGTDLLLLEDSQSGPWSKKSVLVSTLRLEEMSAALKGTSSPGNAPAGHVPTAQAGGTILWQAAPGAGSSGNAFTTIACPNGVGDPFASTPGETLTVTQNVSGDPGVVVTGTLIGDLVDISLDHTAIVHNDLSGGAATTAHGTTSAIVGVDDSQTLTNKTLTAATLAGTTTLTGPLDIAAQSIVSGGQDVLRWDTGVGYLFDEQVVTATVTLAAKGEILTHNGTTFVDFSAGTDGQVLVARPAAAEGMAWEAAPSGTDASAIHYDGVSEYNSAAQKTSIVGGDRVLIEDAAAGFAKKWVRSDTLTGSTATELFDDETPELFADLDTLGNDITTSTGDLGITTTAGDINLTPTGGVVNINGNEVIDSAMSVTLGAGSILYYDGTNFVDLDVGTDGQVLAVNDSGGPVTIEWVAATSGTGDVVGPGSATNNALARFDTTTGKLIQDSAVTVADTSGNMQVGAAGAGTLDCGTLTVTGNIAVTGTVDTVDVAGLKSDFDAAFYVKTFSDGAVTFDAAIQDDTFVIDGGTGIDTDIVGDTLTISFTAVEGTGATVHAIDPSITTAILVTPNVDSIHTTDSEEAIEVVPYSGTASSHLRVLAGGTSPSQDVILTPGGTGTGNIQILGTSAKNIHLNTSGGGELQYNGDEIMAQGLAAAQGDILLASATPAFAPLSIGLASQVLTSNGTTALWAPSPSAAARRPEPLASLVTAGWQGEDESVSGTQVSGTVAGTATVELARAKLPAMAWANGGYGKIVASGKANFGSQDPGCRFRLMFNSTVLAPTHDTTGWSIDKDKFDPWQIYRMFGGDVYWRISLELDGKGRHASSANTGKVGVVGSIDIFTDYSPNVRHIDLDRSISTVWSSSGGSQAKGKLQWHSGFQQNDTPDVSKFTAAAPQLWRASATHTAGLTSEPGAGSVFRYYWHLATLTYNINQETDVDLTVDNLVRIEVADLLQDDLDPTITTGPVSGKFDTWDSGQAYAQGDGAHDGAGNFYRSVLGGTNKVLSADSLYWEVCTGHDEVTMEHAYIFLDPKEIT